MAAAMSAAATAAAVLPRLSTAAVSFSSRSATVFTRQLSLPVFPTLSIAIPSAIQLNIPGLLEGLWEGVLRAVPKKKTSHSKKRSRLLAGKALQDLTNLNRCSACGALKRSHLLCPYCVKEIQKFFKAEEKAAAQTTSSSSGTSA